MSNLDILMKRVPDLLNSNKEDTVMFISLEMLYAKGQTELHHDTAKLQIIGGKATGTYALNTGYYRLMMMLLEFQKVMNKFLHQPQNTFTVIDDIMIVTKLTIEQHIQKVEERIKHLTKLESNERNSK